jgi:NADH-quinone oxidoreductase subunit J
MRPTDDHQPVLLCVLGDPAGLGGVGGDQVIVYVGAVAVLFMFVVMMLDVDFVQLREGFQKYAPVGAAVGVVLFGELVAVLFGWQIAPGAAALRLSATPGGMDNTRALGQVLYTDYVLLFQMSGLILLVAMIGAIVLTHRQRLGTKRQNITRQQERLVGDTLEIVQVRSGAGIAELGVYRRRPEGAHAPAPEPAQGEH